MFACVWLLTVEKKQIQRNKPTHVWNMTNHCNIGFWAYRWKDLGSIIETFSAFGFLPLFYNNQLQKPIETWLKTHLDLSRWERTPMDWSHTNAQSPDTPKRMIRDWRLKVRFWAGNKTSSRAVVQMYVEKKLLNLWKFQYKKNLRDSAFFQPKIRPSIHRVFNRIFSMKLPFFFSLNGILFSISSDPIEPWNLRAAATCTHTQQHTSLHAACSSVWKAYQSMVFSSRLCDSS